MEAKRSTLPAALDLLGEILREPSFPEAEFDRMKRASLAASAMGRTEPSVLAANRLNRLVAPYPSTDIRYVPTPEESAKRLEAVALEQVKAVYKDQVGATAGELAVVGDFDPEPTLTKVREILKGWKAAVPVERIGRTAPADLKGTKESIVTPDKANATFTTGLVFAMEETHPEYAALRLGNFILGGGALSSRLGNRIRQKEGLSYGVSSSMAGSPQDRYARFTVTAIVNPSNIDRLEKVFFEEMKAFLDKGPSEAEVADARKGFLESQKVGRTTDAALAGQIANNLHLGRTFAHTTEQEKRIAAVTAADIKRAFGKYIDPKKLIVIRAGDFGK